MQNFICLISLLLGLVASNPVKAQEPVDIMLVTAHADDEGIFGGAVLPYYAQVLDLNVLLLTMTSRKDMNDTADSREDDRIVELKNAVTLYSGQPLFDVDSDDTRPFISGNITLEFGRFVNDSTTWNHWGSDPKDARERASDHVAKIIRIYKPKVVASAHSLKGDYVHGNHIATAIATVEGVTKAEQEIHQLDGLATHTVSKLYLRGLPEDNVQELMEITPLHAHFHDYWEENRLLGSSPRQATDWALKQHVSESYIEPQASSVFCAPFTNSDSDPNFRNANPNPNMNWWGYFGPHASEKWTLVKSEFGPEKTSNFTRGRQQFTNASQGDFLAGIKATPASPMRPAWLPVIATSNVSVIEFTEGTFERIDCRTWEEIDTNGNVRQKLVQEYPRRDASGQLLVLRTGKGERFRINLENGTISLATARPPYPVPAPDPKTYTPPPDEIAWDAGRLPEYEAFKPSRVHRRINARQVSRVGYDGLSRKVAKLLGFSDAPGAFVKSGKSWKSTTFPQFDFQELQGDTWSVHLYEESRGVHVQLDLHQRKVVFWGKGIPRQTIAAIISAR